MEDIEVGDRGVEELRQFLRVGSNLHG